MDSLNRNFKIIIPLLLTLQGIHAYAVDGTLSVQDKHLLPKAVQVQITQRGMKLFDSQLGQIMGNLGIKLDEGYFPAMTYTFDKDINPNDFAQSNPDAVKTYNQVRDMLTHWLVGFSLNNPRPTIEIGESGYVASFSRFALVTDEPLMRALGKVDGAVLAIELEIKHLTIGTSSVTVWDTKNKFLGKVGLEEASLTAGDGKVPLKIRLPFYIRTNAYGLLEFQALEVSNNLDTTPVTLQYKKLLIPTFAVEINGQKFFLNNSEVDKLLNEQAPNILNKIRENLGDFAHNKLPALLNQKAKQFLSGSLEQVQPMVPPGKEANDHRPDFKWGLVLEKINLKNSLNVDLTAYAEDPVNPKSAPRKVDGARGAPKWGLLTQDKYDIGLSLDRGLINRILQLAYERKNFEQIKMTDGSTLKLKSTPLIDYVNPPTGVAIRASETFVKLHVSVETAPNSIFLKDTIIIEFDIIAKLRQMADKGGMQLILYTIDADSLKMDDSYLSLPGRLVKNKVREGVKDKLRKQCATWKTKEEAIPGSLPLPPEILGIKLDINRVIMDPNGHLVMYLDYAKTGVK